MRSRVSQILDNQNIIELLMNDTFSRKLSITTLAEVFQNFKNACTQKDWEFNFNTYNRESVIFSYEEKNWRATITKEFSTYNNVPTKFINIKLPNDSFLYSDKYVDKQGSNDAIVINKDTETFIQMLDDFVPFKEGFAQYYYKESEGRFEIYFNNDDKSNPNIFTIKFEYGTYENWSNGQKYTRSKMRDLYKSLS